MNNDPRGNSANIQAVESEAAAFNENTFSEAKMSTTQNQAGPNAQTGANQQQHSLQRPCEHLVPSTYDDIIAAAREQPDSPLLQVNQILWALACSELDCIYADDVLRTIKQQRLAGVDCRTGFGGLARWRVKG